MVIIYRVRALCVDRIRVFYINRVRYGFLRSELVAMMITGYYEFNITDCLEITANGFITEQRIRLIWDYYC